MDFEVYLKNYPHRFNQAIFPECQKLMMQAPGHCQAEAQETLNFIERGGKRFRSAWFSYCLERLVSNPYPQIEALLELFHVGLLIHDDLVDHAEERRGEKAFHLQIGDNDRALIWGDFIFSLIFNEFLKTGSLELSKIFSNVFQETCKGQLQDLSLRMVERERVSMEGILECYANKTGLYGFYMPIVLALACKKTPYDALKIKSITKHCGVLYQISDDLTLLEPSLDPKSSQTDWEQGQMTFVMWVLQNQLGNLIWERQKTFSDWLMTVREHENFKRCLAYIQSQMEDCKNKIQSECLDMEDSRVGALLSDVTSFVVNYSFNRLDVLLKPT